MRQRPPVRSDLPIQPVGQRSSRSRRVSGARRGVSGGRWSRVVALLRAAVVRCFPVAMFVVSLAPLLVGHGAVLLHGVDRYCAADDVPQGSRGLVKSYDRAYFERWYRDPADRVSTRDSLTRKVRMAVGIAEFLLGRPIRTVLDVGCGEAPWQPVLARLRPKVRYVGVDSSEYVIERFGEARNIRRGSITELAQLRLPRNIDLLVCADVLQYLGRRDIERALVAMRRLLGGVAYIEAFAIEDFMEGDREGWHERSAAAYRQLFHRAGLTHCAPHCYVDLERFDTLNAFEHERP
jgi:SAM-dependent methyltransferase